MQFVLSERITEQSLESISEALLSKGFIKKGREANLEPAYVGKEGIIQFNGGEVQIELDKTDLTKSQAVLDILIEKLQVESYYSLSDDLNSFMAKDSPEGMFENFELECEGFNFRNIPYRNQN